MVLGQKDGGVVRARKVGGWHDGGGLLSGGLFEGFVILDMLGRVGMLEFGSEGVGMVV